MPLGKKERIGYFIFKQSNTGMHRKILAGGYFVPNVDGYGEYNLLLKEAQQFRKTKCGGKAGEYLSHSRQRVSGIRIPTLFPAVVGEWGNVKT